MRRGEIWWARLGPPKGSEPGYRRPVVIVQSDDFNRSKIGTVVAVTLTTNLRLEGAPGNVLLSKRASKLPRDSVVNVSQVITLDKSCLAERVGALTVSKMSEVDAGLRLVLDL